MEWQEEWVYLKQRRDSYIQKGFTVTEELDGIVARTTITLQLGIHIRKAIPWGGYISPHMARQKALELALDSLEHLLKWQSLDRAVREEQLSRVLGDLSKLGKGDRELIDTLVGGGSLDMRLGSQLSQETRRSGFSLMAKELLVDNGDFGGWALSPTIFGALEEKAF